MDPHTAHEPFPLRREGDLRRVADLEQRVQLLDEAIARVQQTESRLTESEASLRRMAEACGGLLHGGAAVEQFEALNDRLSKLVEESARRIGQFESGVGREWEALRELYEQPLQAFQEQALAIRRTSFEAAQSAALCKQIAEDAFAAIATRGRASVNVPVARASESHPWPLDDVTRVHHDVRSAQQRAMRVTSEDDANVDNRYTGPTFDIGSKDQSRSLRRGVLRWSALGLLLLAFGGIVVYSLRMRERVGLLDSRVQDAAARTADAERQTAEARLLAQQQVLDAQRTARYAQAISDIVTAPDLRRINLVGRAPAPEASAQALFSRARGFHLSAFRLPRTPKGKVYHVWALAQGDAASLGVFEPDQDGRGDLLVDQALTLPRVTGLIVSLEDSAGTGQPTGMIYLGPRPRLEE